MPMLNCNFIVRIYKGGSITSSCDIGGEGSMRRGKSQPCAFGR